MEITEITQEHKALLSATTKLLNFIEEHNVEDDFDAESGDKWRSSEFDEVIKLAKSVLASQEGAKHNNCLSCQYFVNGNICNQTIFAMFMKQGVCTLWNREEE